MTPSLKKRIITRWREFRQWQVTPYRVPPLDITAQHECINCGESYEGACCPRCGQPAKWRRLTLRNLLSNFFDVWGMGSRSMPRALLHLLLRPGYMIGDYIKGHRQPYFPPFKMLFVLTTAAMLLAHYLPGEATVPAAAQASRQEVTQAGDPDAKASAFIMLVIDKAMNANPSLALLGWQFFFTIGMSVFFKKSPRLGRATFTEQFFAQVLIAVQLQFLSIFYMLLFFSGNESQNINLPLAIMAALFLIDCKQLYGYSWGHTLWRFVLANAVTFTVELALIIAMAVAVFIYYDFA